MDSKLTPKAEQTRQHIQDIALDFFSTKGYTATTMREIAAAAGCSLGLTYRYFGSKEALVLSLYERLAADTLAGIDQLAPGTLADRFGGLMRQRLPQMVPYRDVLGALFGAAMNPAARTGILGDSASQTRADTRQAFLRLVNGSGDAPKAAQAEALVTLLVSLHFGIILFWLVDHSPDQQKTFELLDYCCNSLAMLRKTMILPPVARQMLLLAQIIEPVFFGD